jgi:uncharacterized protein (TIGR02680 family)
MTSRYRPTRAGIVNLWDYTDEVFAFAGGRLVLRGANGAGKTKALEVLFPFVLDGRLDPRRLDPFSGENRTMKENLLWRGRDASHGFAWLEFGDGADYVTVGVGLRAQRHRPSPDAWFFVADGRVGDEIVLVDPDGRPRTKAALAESLGEGVVVERAGEHRRRVDERLFGLGPERYEAMLDLVLTLRRPMLAKDLDPRQLSETLARGLRPLDDELLDQVARAFDDLEAAQRDLDRLVAADEAAQRFLTEYRGYLRTQARHRADAAIEATAARAAAAGRLADAHRAVDEARAVEAMAEAEAAAVRERLVADRARHDALTASDAFRTAGQLEHLERSVRDLAGAVERAERHLAAADAELAGADAEHDRAARALATAQTEVDRARPRLAASAVEAGVVWERADGEGAGADVRLRVEARAAARDSDIDAVRLRFEAVAEADRRVEVAGEAADRARARLDEAATRLAEAETAVTGARAAAAAEVTAWAGVHPTVVEPGDLEEVLSAVERFGDDGAPVPTEVWRDRIDPRRASATADRARLGAALSDLGQQAEAIGERRAAILDERDDAPPPVPWRGGGRAERPGAPLWRLVRFADGVDAATAAGVEAALEAAGLLDAWVAPDGSVDAARLDAFVAPAAGGDGAGWLARILLAEDTPAVPTDVVDRVVAAVGAAVQTDGRYRLGPLAGAHTVPAARYIGATARAAHRAARVAALDAELAELQIELDAVAEQAASVEAWLAAAEAATAALPRPAALAECLRTRHRTAGEHQHARAALDDATRAAEAARREANDRRLALRREVEARGVPGTAEGIAGTTAALAQFRRDGSDLAAALALVEERGPAVALAERRRAEAGTRQAGARDDVADRRREHDGRLVELTTLRDRMGAGVAAVLAELAEVDAAITAGEGDERRLATAVQEAAARRGQAEGEVHAAEEALAAAGLSAAEAERRLEVLRRPDLSGPLELTVADGAPPEVLLDAVDSVAIGVSASEERRKGAQTRVLNGHEDLQHTLGAGYRPSWDFDDDVIVVTVADDAGVRPMGAFADGLRAQRAEQEALLTAKERALFEDTLLASVCTQIHGRILATRDLVAAMDREMQARRMSSGHTVGVAWRADDGATPEWRVVHRLLDQDPAHFGPDQLESLRRHFAVEIRSARAAEPDATYREVLARVLDYRTWRRFELSLVEADGHEAALTKARHARLSGGEKAASLHLPLFAAAHAAFAGARPSCPRLLALDEAFAGIDDQGRAELLSLTVAFDLDLFMTGFDLWAVDRTVPAAAHYDLLHLIDDHAVSSLLVLWNGAELVEGPDAEAELATVA